MYKIITISRQYGSGGHEIGKRVSEQLGIPFYDKSEIIRMASKASSIDISNFKNAELSGVGSNVYKITQALSAEVYHNLSLDDKVYYAQCAVIRKIAAKGPCVIVGRGACKVLQDDPLVLRTYVYADIEERARRVVEQYNETDKNIKKYIQQIDKKRMAYYEYYEKKKDVLWTDHFDLCLNSGKLGIDKTVEIICNAYND